MEETRKTSSRRLVKRERLPPPVAYLNNKSSTLKRAPSAASYFTPNQGLGLPSPSTSLSADTQTPGSSLRRSPSLTPVHEHQRAAANVKYPPAQAPAPSFAHLPPASVGEPFNAIVEEALNASSYSYTTATAGPRRPAGPQHSQTADQPSRFRSPKLRQSASFNTLARKMDTPPSGTKSPRNRYSDDGDLAKKRRSDGGKKKGTFSTFMSSMLAAPPDHLHPDQSHARYPCQHRQRDRRVHGTWHDDPDAVRPPCGARVCCHLYPFPLLSFCAAFAC